MARFTFLSSLLILLLLTGPAAEAIVVTCPNGFNNCDPYSGTCYTAWTANLAGQVQAQCNANPASCFQSKLTSPPTCDDPISTPVNPNAIRVCPPLADCGSPEAFAARHYILTIDSPPVPANWRITAPGNVMRCWTPDAFVSYRVELDALACTVDSWRRGFGFHLGLINGQLPPDVDAVALLSHEVVADPNLVYEPPGNTCAWDIRPAPITQPCVLPQSALLAQIKFMDTTQLDGLINYTLDTEERIRVKRWAMNNGLFGSFTGARFRVQVGRLLWLTDLLDLLKAVLRDPPNSNYTFLPGPGVYPPLSMPPADATFTQAQINANTTWLTALREVVLVGKQMADTMDNLGGAILATEAGTPGAGVWARQLALHADAVMATLSSRGLTEIAQRAAVVAAGPVVNQPAACLTATDAANMLQESVLEGNSLYLSHLRYEGAPGCGPATADPAWLTTDAPSDTAMWTSLASLGLASRLCAANAAYCARFGDVPTTHIYYSFIESIAKAGITGGCATLPVPMYCPDSTITRAQMAIFLLRGMHGAGFQPPPPQSQTFSDVPFSHPQAAWIYRLAAEGITGGCGPTTYCPDGAVTRGQMAVFLLRAKHGAGYQPPNATGMFSDVPLNHIFVKWIEQLAREGITGGCGPTTYCPDSPVNRGQMAVFMQRTFNLPL